MVPVRGQSLSYGWMNGAFGRGMLSAKGYDVNDIDVSTVLLNDTVETKTKPVEIGDYDGDGIPDLMVKFDRAAVQELLDPGDQVEITLSGQLEDGTPFEGSDKIRVIN